MKAAKRRIIFTLIIIVCAVLLILLGVLSLITKSFAVRVIQHVYFDILSFPIIIKFMQKYLRSQLPCSMNKALILCGCVIFCDMVIIDAIRFVLSHGISTILFLPTCLPSCFMIIWFYSYKDSVIDRKTWKKFTCIVGIPLFILSLYFEILSFVHI